MRNETVKFVELVKTYPCLYNHTLPEYSEKDITDRAWVEIAHQMEWLATDCKEKWRNICNAFVRSLKPYQTGSTSKAKRPYYLRDIMAFALPYVMNVPHSDNNGMPHQCDTKMTPVENVEVNNGGGGAVFVEKPMLEKKKRKIALEENDIDQKVLQYIQVKKERQTPDDFHKMFLLSLLPDVRSLSGTRLRQFKIRTMLLLEELLTEQERDIGDKSFLQPSSHCSHYHVSTPAPSPNDMQRQLI